MASNYGSVNIYRQLWRVKCNASSGVWYRH